MAQPIDISGYNTAFREFVTFAENAMRKPDGAKAIAKFADAYAGITAELLNSMYMPLFEISRREYTPPVTFATGLTDVLLGNFDALQDTLTDDEKKALKDDTLGIAWGELGLWIPSPANVLQAMKEDAEKSAGDKDYKVDIGV